MVNTNLFRDLLRYGKIKADFEAKDTMGGYFRVRVFEYQEKKYFTVMCDGEQLRFENSILSQNADTAFQDGLNEAQDLYAEQIKIEVAREIFEEMDILGTYNPTLYDELKKKYVGD